MRYIVATMMLCFLLIGIWLIWQAIKSFMLLARRLPYLREADGVVLRVESRRGIKSAGSHRRATMMHFPVIHFQTSTGEHITFRSAVGDGTQATVGLFGRYKPPESSSYHAGQQLRVRYDPDKQIEPMLASWWGMWFPNVGLALSGIVFIGSAALIWWAFGHKIMGGY